MFILLIFVFGNDSELSLPRSKIFQLSSVLQEPPRNHPLTPPPSKKKALHIFAPWVQILKDFVYQSAYYLLSYCIIYYQSKASAVAGRSYDELHALALP